MGEIRGPRRAHWGVADRLGGPERTNIVQCRNSSSLYLSRSCQHTVGGQGIIYWQADYAGVQQQYACMGLEL